MVKEYCDKCKREILIEDTNDRKGKRNVELFYSDWSCGYDRIRSAKITLCKDCFAEMEIHEMAKRIGSNNKEEKEPTAVEKLMDIIKELVTECLEEQGGEED